MDHEQAQSNFSDYVDGSLSERVRAEVDAHLAACIQCRTNLQQFRDTMGKLASLKKKAPATFLPDIKQQINTRSRGRFFGKRWLLFGRIPFEWVSLVMIVVMLVYYIITLQSSPTTVTPTR